MTITVGSGTSGANKRVLRLTFSEGDRRLAEQAWGGPRPVVSYTARELIGGRWLLTFRADPDGNVAGIRTLRCGGGRDKEYMTWYWALSDNQLLGLPPILARAHEGELVRWNDNGTFEIIVRGKRVAPRRAAPTPRPVPVASGQDSAAAHRLGALRVALNQAIAEARQAGLKTRVVQEEEGEPITVTIMV